MIGDKGKEIIANTLKYVSVARTLPFSLSTDYIHEIEYMTRQPGVYQSNFIYVIRYAPSSVFKKNDGKPFVVRIDFFDTIKKGCHRFKDFESFCNDEDFKHIIPFLLKYTNLSQELFDLAKDNLYCDIPVSFDILRYIHDVKETYREKTGSEIDKFIFLSEHMLEANAFLNEEKIASREASKNKKQKGVVEKCT